MNMLTCKEATVEDIEDIIAIADQTWKQTYRNLISEEQIDYMYDITYTPEALIDQIENQNHTFFIAYDQDQPLGYASISKIDHAFKLHKLYVLPNTHGKGVGKFLINKAAEEIKKRNGRTMQLIVHRANTANQFYQRLGFKMIKEVDIPLDKFFLNAFVLEKELQ